MQPIARFFRSSGNLLWVVAVICFVVAFSTHAGLAALVGAAAGAAMFLALRSRYLVLAQWRQGNELEGRNKQAFFRVFNERRQELGPVLLVLIILAIASIALLYFAYGTGVLLSFAFVPPAVWLVRFSEGPANPKWYAAEGIRPLYTETRSRTRRGTDRASTVVEGRVAPETRPDVVQVMPHPVTSGIRPDDPDVVVIDAECTDVD